MARDQPPRKLQLRWGRKFYFIGPAIGLIGNTDGGVFGYGGIYADLAYGNIIVTPVLAAGGYAEGDSKDLGGVFQFRTELGIAYEFDDGTRIGARFAHISNAFIHDDNPGEEELFITFAIPFRKSVRRRDQRRRPTHDDPSAPLL